MPTKEPGYVYILTNPSFKEDWVKIGRSSRPVNVRSKELDNTAVPLPFEIYATLKTEKYVEAEKLIHRYIERFTNLRIRDNREFFNVQPEVALDIFRDVAEVLGDAVIEEVHKKSIMGDAPERQKGSHKTPFRQEARVWILPANSHFFDLLVVSKNMARFIGRSTSTSRPATQVTSTVRLLIVLFFTDSASKGTICPIRRTWTKNWNSM